MPLKQSSGERQLEWISLTDFRPGIYNRSQRALGNTAVPAPLGAAQFTNTYRCIALPSGGLAPLPKMIKTWAGADPADTYADGPWLVGMYAFGPTHSNPPGVESSYPDEIIAVVEYINATPRRKRNIYRFGIFNTPVTYNLLDAYASAYATPVHQYWASTFGSTRMNTVDPTLAGTPVVVVEWSEQAGEGGAHNVYTFPNPAAANVTALYNLGARAGQILCHQGRVVLLEVAIYLHGADGNVPTNENISFTDPANSITFGSQGEVFVQEAPVGYGAWGSISAGELFLVKNSGGGVIISGDIANPSITRLPGVVSTGQITSKAASTPQGLFYLVNEGGVYSWRGGDTSTHVSAQLDPNSFPNNARGTSPDTLSPSMLGPVAHLEAWQDWVVTSNNWLFDTEAGGWWQLESQSVVNCRWWSRGSHHNLMYGAPVAYSVAAAIYTWDKSQPATSYSWQSQPIPASTERYVEVREMVLNAQGSGTVTVTLTASDSSTQAETFTVTNTSQPQRLRPAQGGTFAKGYNVVVRIASDGGSGAAPVVHGLHLGCRLASHVGAV